MKFYGCPSRLQKWPWCSSAVAHSDSKFSLIRRALFVGLLCAIVSVLVFLKIKTLAGHQSILPEKDGLGARGD